MSPQAIQGSQEDAIKERVVAQLVDTVIVLFLAVLVAGAIPYTIRDLLLIAIGVSVVYSTVLEALFAQTVGKRVLRVMVMDQRSGSAPSVVQAIVRNVVRPLDSLFYYAVGLLAMLLTRDTQRIGDVAANTVVVKTQRSLHRSSRSTVPRPGSGPGL